MNFTGFWIACTAMLAPLPEQAKPDGELLQGRWIVVSAELGGIAQDEIKGDVLEIARDQVIIHSTRNNFQQKGTVKLDPSKKPKTIDFTMTGPDANGRNVVIQGICEFDADTLKLCFCPPGGERPKEFASPRNDDRSQAVMLIRLQREKK